MTAPPLAVSPTDAAEVLARHADEAADLLDQVREVESTRDYEAWSTSFERWCALTRAGLATIYRSDRAAEDFGLERKHLVGEAANLGEVLRDLQRAHDAPLDSNRERGVDRVHCHT